MYQLKIKSHFDAAHLLKGYPGKCANLHGHTWKYMLTLTGVDLDSLGMLVDFSVIKAIMKTEVEDLFDHAYLNDKLVSNPTAENIAHEIYSRVNYLILGLNLTLSSVEVWESENCSAIYKP